MSKEAFNKIMTCLDLIENELNKIALHVGHSSFDSWHKEKK